MPNWLRLVLNSPFSAIGLRIALIALLALATGLGLQLITRRMEHQQRRTIADAERLDRLHTLLQAGRNTAYIVILILAAFMTLYTLGINIAPLLAGASVAGLALSLGAQTLIKDFIGGILILTEGQFTVGDVIQVGSASGGVERITLRATWLRDVDGKLLVVPNGDIRLVSNLTAGWANANVNLNIGYETDMGKVMRALQSAAEMAKADETIKADLIEAPRAVGWIGFTDWAVLVQLTAKTAPGKQWGVMMALRKYAVEALRAEGVKMAIPSQQIRMENNQPLTD
jgi:small-conductance mechanosensitive channel